MNAAPFSAPPTPVASSQPAVLPYGLARLATPLYRGAGFDAMQGEFLARIQADTRDAAALMDYANLCRLVGALERADACQQLALQVQRRFRIEAASPHEPALRLLMLAVPGDFMTNTPVEFLIDGAQVRLDTVYLYPGESLPADLPEHDVLLTGVAESPAARAMLAALGPALAAWPRPVINAPARILDLARERLFELLGPLDGVAIPSTVMVDDQTLRCLATGSIAPEALAGDLHFPLIARPAGTHAGDGLEKIEDGGRMLAFLTTNPSASYYVSRFVDYRSADGQYRKYRVALIDGTPFLVHMAISEHWLVHYLNAGMASDEIKRREEADEMRAFDSRFGARHRAALSGIATTLGLDYLCLDCAETPDGRLLVFEAGTAMIVHRMDPPEVFPYKQAQMDQVCNAFVALLRARMG